MDDDLYRLWTTSVDYSAVISNTAVFNAITYFLKFSNLLIL